MALVGPDAAAAERPTLTFVEHHLAHARSAFHASGFDQAAVLVVDSAGEQESISIYGCVGSTFARKRHWPTAFSLGAMYEAVTRFVGLGNLNAGKTMGLASYGDGQDTALLPLGDLVGGGPPPFEWRPETHYNEFTDRWIQHVADRFGKVPSLKGALRSGHARWGTA